MVKTDKQRAKHAAYMRAYNTKNKVRIAPRIAARRKERIIAGDDILERHAAVNRKYYTKHKDEINARAKARNWNYNPVARVGIRKRHYMKNPAKQIIRRRKDWSKENNMLFDLTEEWYKEQYDKGCVMTGLPFSKSGENSPWIAHIDRIIPENGYIKTNCRLVCACYNLAKKNWEDRDVLKMAKALVERTSDA